MNEQQIAVAAREEAQEGWDYPAFTLNRTEQRNDDYELQEQLRRIGKHVVDIAGY